MRNRTRSSGAVGLLVVAVVVLAAVWWLGRGSSEAGDPSAARPGTTASSSSAPSASSASRSGSGSTTDPASGLPTVARADLPREARRTLDLIAAGGPFPYERDGVVFQNRERILPPQARGWYHEYTVPTPGEGDRGARRIVTGRDGVAYWSPDHYATFSVVEEDP
ncbi:ribonuclease [Phycicoccus sp. HDW14]|uniref:ribonuclease domain-containing protein n=1 Tax=Phycicoccus sp. HDW14 TaxID=2714941 RepID=UPI0014095007|nr:ribonuclease domain-containing protein [Phycicoccus sp. HDW14]QIM22718.1 ribonuclease [Phycicoccus sp. HDW14]